MKVFAVTDVGSVRQTNEDAFCLPKAGERFCAVADGMGGHNAGEVASSLAVETFAGFMRASGTYSVQSLKAAVKRANGIVHAESILNPARAGMGTTFSALAIIPGGMAIAHVGDSRIYRVRDGEITQLTQDHTLVASMVKAGEISPEQAKQHPKRNYITRAVGVNDTVEIDAFETDIAVNDVYLLCTDGLHGVMEDVEMLSVSLGSSPWEEKLRVLTKLAIAAGSTDNITAMYMVVEEDDV